MERSRIARSSNIELLRQFAMEGVIFLHYYNASMGGASKYVTPDTPNEFVLMVLEAMAICAVDLFVMISGYFLSRNNERYVGKAIVMIMQVSVYRVVYYLLDSFLSQTAFNPVAFLKMLLPVNWFVILYITTYLLSPLINKALQNDDQEKSVLTIVLILVLFSVWPTIVDVIKVVLDSNINDLSTIGMYGSERGYTITNFFVCYSVGASLNRLEIRKSSGWSKLQWSLMALLVLDLIIITAWSYWDALTAREYCNPLVVLFAALLLYLFLSLEIGQRPFINKMAAASFSVYLIHAWLLPFLKIEQFVNRHVGVMVMHILASMIGITIIAFLVDCVYHLVAGRIIRKINRFGKYTL